MMLLPHHMDNASPASLCLLGSRRKPRGSAESIHLSPSHGETYQSKKPRLHLSQKVLVDRMGGSFMASVLRQLVYWGQKISDFELSGAKEKRASLQNRSSFYHGWVSRSTQEPLKATLLTVSVFTIRCYLSFLAERGWVQIRKRSQNKWTRAPQYRVNLRKLCIDLQEYGHSLPDFLIYEVLSSSEQENSEKSKRPNINPNTNINFASKGENNFLKGRNL